MFKLIENVIHKDDMRSEKGLKIMRAAYKTSVKFTRVIYIRCDINTIGNPIWTLYLDDNDKDSEYNEIIKAYTEGLLDNV